MELSEKVIQSLTNTQSVNILPEESFMQILDAVVFYLCKTPIDLKGLYNIKADNSKLDTVKSTFANLSCLFVEAARHDFDKKCLEKLLNTILIVDNRVDKLCHTYASNKQEIQMQLQLTGKSLPHIVDTDWRLSHCIKYGFQNSVGSFQYHMRVTTKEYAEIKYVTFTCTLQQLQELLCKIRDAIRHLERIPSN
ncbi:hypothetical protein KPH14_005240 [Odynerus spinipes]|uniref:COMM domain-containing protein 3 n=1 Tax=Odynerus spinipes TaxID=1348599 RepID=A0AAD9RBC3_9HYME|nr:hypothetical protein KPH14_005240 [Odynerus spinipes]